jgi:HD-GYP domain-containing protein (c-di-GMP phosphodiesterase class II)
VEQRVPLPEFISLTYTLPYHLVEQINGVATESNRSPSEILADAMRMYLKTWGARQKHTRISTVEGFSYQEVVVTDTVVDSPNPTAGRPAAPAADAPPSNDGPGSYIEQLRAAAARRASASSPALPAGTSYGRDARSADAPSSASTRTRQQPPSATAPSAAATADDHPRAPHASPPLHEDIVLDITPVAPIEPALPTEDLPADSTAAPTVATTAIEADTPTALPADAALIDAEPMDAGPVDTQPTNAESAADESTEPESVEPDRVELDGGDAAAVEAVTKETDTPRAEPEVQRPAATPNPVPAAVQAIADPAAAARRRLLGVADEPIDSPRLRQTLEQIMRRVDTKDFSPPEHSSKVAAMAGELALAKGFRGQRLQEVILAGLVHDIGKACIPDEVIKKPKPSPEEMALIRTYPELGVELLGTVPSLAPLLPIIAAHQERWNGSGYPQRLQQGDIPLAAQVVALCDVFDVLITDRRYRPAYTEDRARQIIKQSIGTLWNPAIANLFLSQVVAAAKKPPARSMRR